MKQCVAAMNMTETANRENKCSTLGNIATCVLSFLYYMSDIVFIYCTNFQLLPLKCSKNEVQVEKGLFIQPLFSVM